MRIFVTAINSEEAKKAMDSKGLSDFSHMDSKLVKVRLRVKHYCFGQKRNLG